MYDEIDYRCNCPKCGNPVIDFQSKDGDCTNDTLEPYEVDNFYSICNSCELWIEFSRVKESDMFFRLVRDIGNKDARYKEYECFEKFIKPENVIQEVIELLEWYSSDVPIFANIHSRNSVNAEAKDVIMRLKKDV